jgi:hypothetical protein
VVFEARYGRSLVDDIRARPQGNLDEFATQTGQWWGR